MRQIIIFILLVFFANVMKAQNAYIANTDRYSLVVLDTLNAPDTMFIVTLSYDSERSFSFWVPKNMIDNIRAYLDKNYTSTSNKVVIETMNTLNNRFNTFLIIPAVLFGHSYIHFIGKTDYYTEVNPDFLSLEIHKMYSISFSTSCKRIFVGIMNKSKMIKMNRYEFPPNEYGLFCVPSL